MFLSAMILFEMELGHPGNLAWLEFKFVLRLAAIFLSMLRLQACGPTVPN